MSGYNNQGRCHECDGTHGNHYPGCDFEGGGNARLGGSALSQFCFFVFLLFGAVVTAFLPPLGIGIIMLGAKITGV